MAASNGMTKIIDTPRIEVNITAGGAAIVGGLLAAVLIVFFGTHVQNQTQHYRAQAVSACAAASQKFEEDVHGYWSCRP